jgi:hypothetical protein
MIVEGMRSEKFLNFFKKKEDAHLFQECQRMKAQHRDRFGVLIKIAQPSIVHPKKHPPKRLKKNLCPKPDRFSL